MVPMSSVASADIFLGIHTVFLESKWDQVGLGCSQTPEVKRVSENCYCRMVLPVHCGLWSIFKILKLCRVHVSVSRSSPCKLRKGVR